MKRAILIIFVLFFCFSATRNAYSYWIWTPKTGKWINPKSVVKPTPKEQFEYAKGFYDEKKYEDGKREFKKLLKAYPKSFEASESQFYLGLTEEAQGNLYEAYQAYQKVIDKYPFSERIQDILEREYKIGEAFMAGEKRKTFGLALPVDNPAIEIFGKVIDNSTYGPLAPKAEYKLGLVLKSLMRYYEAEDAFNKVITSYPDSEWVEAAKFQIALCRKAQSKGPDYDQGATQEAKDKFEEFVREHPDAVLSNSAEKNINQLNEKEAESNYNIGIFYEKQEQYDSAKIYYNDIVNNNPNSPWASKALERLQILEKKKMNHGLQGIIPRITRVMLLCFVLAGCGYTTRSLISGQFKTIRIEPFVNKVDIANEKYSQNKYRVYRPTLESDVTQSVINKYLYDGNLRPVKNENADLILKGELVEFRRDPLIYSDSDTVTQYRLNIVVNIALYDKKENKLLWKEDNFTGDTSYFTTGANAKSEDAAVNDALADLARRVVERTVEQW